MGSREDESTRSASNFPFRAKEKIRIFSSCTDGNKNSELIFLSLSNAEKKSITQALHNSHYLPPSEAL